MKKWMAAAAAGLLLWNLWLTVELSNLKNRSPELIINDPDGATIVNNTIEGYTTDITKTAADAMQKMVSVSSVTEQGESICSGVIYMVMGTDTWILTSARSVNPDASVSVRFDNGISCEAEFRGKDDLTDIALYLTHPDFAAEPIQVGSSGNLKQGEYVIALSGRDLHTQSGDVSFGVTAKTAQKYRTKADTGEEWISEAVFPDIAMTSQMEGGALINLSGQLVGMLTNVYGNERNGLAAAAGTGDIIQAADEIRRAGSVERGFLGTVTRDIRELELYQKSAMNLPLDRNTGLVVVEVLEDSPAEAAGLQANDIIESADDVLLSAPDSLRKVLYSRAPGDTIELDVIRGGTETAITVTLK